MRGLDKRCGGGEGVRHSLLLANPRDLLAKRIRRPEFAKSPPNSLLMKWQVVAKLNNKKETHAMSCLSLMSRANLSDPPEVGGEGGGHQEKSFTRLWAVILSVI